MDAARGAFAAVVVEPKDAQYLNPATGQAIKTGVVADIVAPDGQFRELVTLFHDGDPELGHNEMSYPWQAHCEPDTPAPAEAEQDPEKCSRRPSLFREASPRSATSAPPGRRETTSSLRRRCTPGGTEIPAWSSPGHRASRSCSGWRRLGQSRCTPSACRVTAGGSSLGSTQAPSRYSRISWLRAMLSMCPWSVVSEGVWQDRRFRVRRRPDALHAGRSLGTHPGETGGVTLGSGTGW